MMQRRRFLVAVAVALLGLLALIATSGAEQVSTSPVTVNRVLGSITGSTPAAGDVGELKVAYAKNTTATITVTIASPGVVQVTAHGLTCASPVYLTTTGALPTGLSVNTTYYTTCGASFLTDSFQLSTTVANAIAGASINTSGTQSGVHTGNAAAFLLNATSADILGISLGAGDWDCRGDVVFIPAGTTTVTGLIAWTNAVAATGPGIGASTARTALNATLQTGAQQWFSLANEQYGGAGTTTAFLGAFPSFGTSTMTAGGRLECRRAS